MLKKLYTLLIVLLLPLCGFAQHEASTWYLGNQNALKFINGTATLVKEGPEFSGGGSSSTYSYEEGKVLLYTDATRVYNKNGAEMNNAILIHSTHLNQSIIIPKPGSRNLFYIFYLGYVNLEKNEYREVDRL